MSRTTGDSSPQDDAIALAGGNTEALEILDYALRHQDKIGRRDRAILLLMMLDMIGCYEGDIVALYRAHGEVFEDMYFDVAKRAGMNPAILP